MMLTNWYNDYLRMISPRTPELEIKFVFGDKNVLDDLIVGTISNLNNFKAKLGLKKINAKISALNELSVMGVIEYLGVLRTIAPRSYLSRDHHKKIGVLAEEFEGIVKIHNDKVIKLLHSETNKYLTKEIAQYINILNIDLFDKTPTEFYDINKHQFINFDGSESYETFIENIKGQPNISKVLDYWDYQNILSKRTLFCPIIQLADGYCDIADHRSKLSIYDRKLQQTLSGDEFLLSDNKREFFPQDYYWWYYGVPKGFEIYNR